MKEIVLKGLDEKIYVDKCDNGMPIYMLVNDLVNNFYITLNVKYGSIDTEFKLEDSEEYIKVPDGIAHYLEHVNFNIGDDETAHDIFKKYGAQINAYTTFDFTSYEVFGNSHFEENINNLLDYVQKPYFTDKLIEKERGIIIEEVKMGKNRPGHKLYYGMNKALFKKDKRRNLVTGEVKDVKKITTEHLKLVFDNFYHPQNMFVVITGNFDPEEAARIIKENQSKKEFIKYKNPVVKVEKEPKAVNKEYDSIECNVEIPKGKLCYKMPLEIFGDIDQMVLGIHLGAILRNNFGNTSLLREELLEKKLVTGVGASSDIEKGLLVIEISFESEHVDEVLEILKKKMEHLEINKEDIIRRRRANIASLINGFDDIEYVNSDISYQLIIYNKIYDDIFDLYNNTSIDIAESIIDKMDLSNNSTVILVPFKK